MINTLALLAMIAAPNEGVTMKFVPNGVTERVGSYMPMRAEMDEKPEIVKKAPEGLAVPKYGTIKIEDQTWNFILDEPEGKPAQLFVDTNGDGDLTNDPATEWKPIESNGLTIHQGKAQIDLGDEKRAGLGVYRFDPNDERRAAFKNTLFYFTDFGYELSFDLDGKTFASFISGKPQPRTFLWIDRDNNKQQSHKLETVVVGKPFNFTGTTYVLRVEKGELKLEKAAEELPVAPMPPDLAIGKKAIPFQMKALDGSEIDFPKSFAGKLVMLDFWATWCGPCIAELPNVRKAYADWHDKGFEIVGISFDREGAEDKLKTFIHEREMPWPQIYEGKGWDTTLGEKYDVSAIPFVLLVDGDSGEILGTARELRGPGLSAFIEKSLEKKNSGQVTN